MRKRNVTYDIWYNMKRRCLDPSHDRYVDYGQKGITVCEDWLDFKKFLADMGPRPPGYTLDRRYNHLGYSKENCRWVTITEQALNKGTRKDNTSGKKGVSWHTQRQKWRAVGTKNGITISLYFGDSYEDAVAARDFWEEANVPKP